MLPVHARTLPSQRRVIIDTDAKNEADDQFAIVHGLLSPSLDVRGIVAAHFGMRPGRSERSMLDSREEVDLLLELMGLTGKVRVENGSPYALPDELTPIPSPGAELIVEEAMREDEGPLYVAFFGPLTDMAAALLAEPRIADRDVTVVWIGGPSYGPEPAANRPEFNLANDIVAANVVFASALEVWQIPRSTYVMTAVSYAELDEKVAPCGELGEYLVRQLVEWNAVHAHSPMEYRSLGDSPAIGVLLNENCGRIVERPAPTFRANGSYDLDRTHRPIRVYETIDSRFLLEDFFAKLRQFARADSQSARAADDRFAE
ncbi:nucleoside hydrolase [Actinopolymorpha singaporensis]|uniref:Inosine-uridine nucleoside N-ribohydrolase n=1 Tax=Actinopolymorpha singaporensis TaxID=117157 RepID=A0A1H1M3F9_9ACTN|nr:nucleoside hydrolase [Actinopolymorpha singaporensis]SDR81022.1 Inosine-uridine nucleoside N-ribohydrolase [Actinopolymorpha singaporensis]